MEHDAISHLEDEELRECLFQIFKPFYLYSHTLSVVLAGS